jgi:fatty acid desaturase
VIQPTLPADGRKFEHELKSRASDSTFGMKLAIYAACLWSGTAASLSDSAALQGLGVVLLGVMFAHGVELQHQALHGQGFRHRAVNEFVGVLLGLPMLVSFAGYQASHLRHHRHLGTPRNREFFDYGDQYGTSPAATLALWARRLLMPAHYLAFCRLSAGALLGWPVPDESEEVARRIRRDHLVMLVAIGALAAASAAAQAPIIAFAWLLPLLLVASPLHALIEMPEHYRCEVQCPDVLRNTRTIRTNPFMTWLTNGNNYHVEHHLMPGLPIDRLHDLHAVIAEDLCHCYPSYRAFYADVLRNRVGQCAPKES